MRTTALSGSAFVCCALTVGGAVLTAELSAIQPQRAPSREASFAETLADVEATQVELVRGRPAAFKALWSHRDDVTLTGGLGGAIEKGWDRVSRRLDRVTSQYAAGSREHTEVARVVGADIAYVVQKEVIRFRPPGQSAQVTQELRAVMVFRLESGSWRMSHRQADSLTAKQSTP